MIRDSADDGKIEMRPREKYFLNTKRQVASFSFNVPLQLDIKKYCCLRYLPSVVAELAVLEVLVALHDAHFYLTTILLRNFTIFYVTFFCLNFFFMI